MNVFVYLKKYNHKYLLLHPQIVGNAFKYRDNRKKQSPIGPPFVKGGAKGEVWGTSLLPFPLYLKALPPKKGWRQ